MKLVNIRAYRVIFPDGQSDFETKEKDGRGAIGCNSIKTLADIVRSRVNHLREKSRSPEEMTHISIDLRPFHNIECPERLASHRCLPLTEEEQDLFWKYFTAPPF